MAPGSWKVKLVSSDASRTEPDGKVETMGMIVVGVDRSTEARTALRFAVEEARFREARVPAPHLGRMGALSAVAGH